MDSVYDFIFDLLNQVRVPKPQVLDIPSQTYDDLGRAYDPYTDEPIDITSQRIQDRSNEILNQVHPLQVPYSNPRPSLTDIIRTSTINPRFQPINTPLPIKRQPLNIQQAFQTGGLMPLNIDPLIQKYFPQDQWFNAQRVMMAESGGENIPSQFNKYGKEESYGPFQINLKAHPQMRATVHIPEENIKYAAQLFKKQGWKPWYNTARKLGLL